MIKKNLCQVFWLACLLLCALSVRAGEKAADSQIVQLGDLSPVVRKTFSEKTKGATILRLIKAPATYNVRLDSQGQKSEMRVTEDGKILRIRSKHEAEAQFEEEQRLAKAGLLNTVSLDDIPTAAKTIIVERAKGMTIAQIIRTPTTFIAQIDHAGKKTEIRVSETGEILE